MNTIRFPKGKTTKIIVYGFLMWLIPFLAAFAFIDASGNFLIGEKFFKSIMIVVGTFAGVVFSVKYFKVIERDFVGEGVKIGVVWLAINLAIDLLLVSTGFFAMTYVQYLQEIGLRLLPIPFYTIGMAYALKNKR